MATSTNHTAIVVGGCGWPDTASAADRLFVVDFVTPAAGAEARLPQAALNEPVVDLIFGPIGSGSMNLFLMIVRLVLEMLLPSRRDGLSLAARADGRLEQVPQRGWAWLLGILSDRPPLRGRYGPRLRAGDRFPALPDPQPGDGS